MTGTSARHRRSPISSIPLAPGSTEVEQDQVGLLLPHQLQRLLRVGAHQGLEVGPGEAVPDELERLRVVVHHENARPPFLVLRGLPGDPGGRGCGLLDHGESEVNRAPRPGPSLSARMRPPWASAIPLQMARAGPDPPIASPPSSPAPRESRPNRSGRWESLANTRGRGRGLTDRLGRRSRRPRATARSRSPAARARFEEGRPGPRQLPEATPITRRDRHYPQPPKGPPASEADYPGPAPAAGRDSPGPSETAMPVRGLG